MGILLLESSSGYSTLTRPGAFLDLTIDWTRMSMAFFEPGSFVDGDDYTVWELRTTDGQTLIRVYAADDHTSGIPGVFSLEVEVWLSGVLLASASTPCASTGWFTVTLRYTAAAGTLDVFIDPVLETTMTVDLSAFPAMDVDSFLQGTGPSNIFVRGCRDRVWQGALSTPTIALQVGSPTTVVFGNRLADTPLGGSTDLTDRSGNGNDWTLSGTAFTVAGPGPAIGAVA